MPPPSVHSARADTDSDDEKSPVFYQGAEDALQELDRLLGRSSPLALEAVHKMTNLIIGKERRLVFYLGAGCSKLVTVHQTGGRKAKFEAPTWKELLKKLLEDNLLPAQRSEFLRTMTLRAGVRKKARLNSIDELLRHFDKPQVACFLSWCFSHREARDYAIGRIVEPAPESDYESTLYDNLLKLPFDDIVTTNYDTNIERFLDNKKIPHMEISDLTGLVNSFNLERSRRLFYLHGRVSQPEDARRSKLVFDRFDYAKMLAERDGMLDYLVYLLRDSHVIYVGFGLDDPTFNLMEMRLRELQGRFRPQSFAFIPFVTEAERRWWADRNLDLIDYGKHDALPEILGHVTTIRQFIEEAEPNRPKGVVPNEDRTDNYMEMALKLYVRGDYKRSLRACRAALASTLFWEREPSHEGRDGASLPFDRAVRVCEIRIRLALNRYKLQWGANIDQSEDHQGYMYENVKEARDIIKAQRKYLDSPRGNKRRRIEECELNALDASLHVLQARILYLDGQFVKAQRQYQLVATEQIKQSIKMEGREASDIIVWRLKLAEAYYYAKCQLSRIDYQFLSKETKNKVRAKRQQAAKDRPQAAEKMVEEMQEVAGEIQGILKHIEKAKKTGKLPQWEYFKNGMGTIYRIAEWTAGRHAVRVCQDVIPTKIERNDDTFRRLSEGIALLGRDLTLDEENIWDVSPRWRALRYRYLCRAYALRWVVGQQFAGHPSAGSDADLITAYEAIQKALEETEKPKGAGLERQRMVTLLEATRLNILAMFGEQIKMGEPSVPPRVSPLSFGAGMHYLDKAFQEMQLIDTALRETERLAEEPHVSKEGHVWWLRILGYRLTSYFVVVSRAVESDEIQQIHDQRLREFLELKLDKMVEKVEQEHRRFAENFARPRALDKRVKYYRKTLEAIRRELAGT